MVAATEGEVCKRVAMGEESGDYVDVGEVSVSAWTVVRGFAYGEGFEGGGEGEEEFQTQMVDVAFD